MKTVLIIGMGKFGHHLCKNLIDLGNEVMVVDQREENVADLIYDVVHVQIGDCTDPRVIKSLGVGNFDLVFVCIGTNFQSSLEITSLVKEMGAKRVISKANRDVHAKFLLRNGADEVIYPDRDISERLARKYSVDHIFDYIEMDDDYSIYEILPLKEWIGKSIVELNIRQKYKINIISIKTGNNRNILPPADYKFIGNEHINILGRKNDVERLLK